MFRYRSVTAPLLLRYCSVTAPLLLRDCSITAPLLLRYCPFTNITNFQKLPPSGPKKSIRRKLFRSIHRISTATRLPTHSDCYQAHWLTQTALRRGELLTTQQETVCLKPPPPDLEIALRCWILRSIHLISTATRLYTLSDCYQTHWFTQTGPRGGHLMTAQKRLLFLKSPHFRA